VKCKVSRAWLDSTKTVAFPGNYDRASYCSYREEGLEMNGLKMMWLELDGQLVCRWVDESDTAETVLPRLQDDLGSSIGVGVNQPVLAIGSAA